MESLATMRPDQTRPDQTIIIPTYNRKEMLSEAVNSVLKQTQKNFEILIIDDCSTDGTEEFVAKNFTDSRIHYFRNEKNSGPEFSRSFGLRHAKGKYITFLDDDDYYTDYEFFDKAIKIFEEHDTENAPLAFVGANAKVLTVETGEISDKHKLNACGRVNGIDYILKCNKPLSTFPTVFKAEILRKAGLENMMIFDTETYFQAALLGDAWFISDYIGVYRIHKESITLGYKHNSKHEARYYAKVSEMARRIKIIADSLYYKADKTQVRIWYIKSLIGVVIYANFTMDNDTKNKIFKYILKSEGFAPDLWIAFFLRFVRDSLRRITPLRKFYRFIKYRGHVPED